MSTETKQAPNVAGVLAMQFRFAGGTFAQNTRGITHEESLVGPASGGNCMQWIAAHLLIARNGILELLGQPPVRNGEELARFTRGSEPLTDPAEALDWTGLLEDFEKAQQAIQEGLGRITPERLAEPMPADRNPFQVANVGEMLGVLLFHEVYHVGQLGVVRRTLGKEAAIR